MWRTLPSASSRVSVSLPRRSSPAHLLLRGASAATLRRRRLSTTHAPAASLPPLQPRLTAAADLRSSFLRYFQHHRHLLLPSSSLLPAAEDSSLLFTNAGMVQLKEMLTGVRPPPPGSSGRLTSVQKCLRAGGKHNDLEHVGVTARHHTFFEMLGNFSIGSYFKEEAIVLAWNYLTKELGIPPSRLRISVHHSDSESARLWSRLTGFTEAPAGSTLGTAGEGGMIVCLGDADNFWSMGDSPGTPCGPCSEIFFDQGTEVDGERWLEVWNLVFMQYARGEKAGELIPLEKPCVDTGMGLERVAAVLQGQPTNYDSDLLKPSILAARELALQRTGRSQTELQYTNGLSPSPHCTAFKVIVDHLRSCAFLLADGVVPSNVGRGYVLRRIIRRAVRYGGTIGLNQPFLSDLLPPLLASLGPTYPELHERLDVITSTMQQEEANFFATLARGVKVLEEAFSRAPTSSSPLPGSTAFLLYDTYGFPLDLTMLISRERGRTVDATGFERRMKEQRERSRGGGLKTSSGGDAASTAAGEPMKSSSSSSSSPALEEDLPTPNLPVPKEVKQWSSTIQTTFIGYTTLTHSGSPILASYYDANTRSVWLAVKESPFYASAGGQVGDTGVVETRSHETGKGETTQWRVVDTLKAHPGCDVLRLHVPRSRESAVKDAFKVEGGRVAEMKVDALTRHATSVHHTATHLLHSALKAVLSRTSSSSSSNPAAAKIHVASVNQAGSLVSPERLRFDFSCPVPLTQVQLSEIEQWVNDAALSSDRLSDLPSSGVKTNLMSRAEAAAMNATALFGEKYGETVRVVSVPGYSTELCGGTHVLHSRSIHPFVILSEGGVASGIRRMEAVAGERARRYLEEQRSSLKKIASELKVHPDSDSILGAISKVQSRATEAERALRTMQVQAIEEKKTTVAQGFLTWKGLAERRFTVVLTSIPRSAAQPAVMKEAALAFAKKSGDEEQVYQVLMCAETGDVVIAAPTSSSSTSSAKPPVSPPTAKQIWLHLASQCVLPDQQEKKARGGGGAEVAQGVLPVGSCGEELLTRVTKALLGEAAPKQS